MNLVPIDKAGEILANYIDQELIPKAGGFQKISVLIIGTALAKRVPEVLLQYGETLRMLGMLVEDEFLDLDVVYSLSKSAFERAGKVSAAGIIFSVEDVEKIHSIAKKYVEEVEEE